MILPGLTPSVADSSFKLRQPLSHCEVWIRIVNKLVKKGIESRKRKTESEYDETKREFEMAMGKPFITIKVEIPTGFENLHSHF